MKIDKTLNAIDSMYPTVAFISDGYSIDVTRGNSLYGYVIEGSAIIGGIEVGSGHVFAMSYSDTDEIFLNETSKVWAVSRKGFKVPFTITKPEQKGRLSYIDGCSDTLLVYPPRKGDGSMSLLYFPPMIEQSWHSHPSLRMGYVLSGSGFYEVKNPNGIVTRGLLEVGQAFHLEEHEQHRFCTIKSDMRILAYHPDGDWGPEDHNHTMLNRTYVK